MTTNSTIERFVPQGQPSLVDDAPGWTNDASKGPICWKCRGAGVKQTKKRPVGDATPPIAVECPVCHGSGHLPVKKDLSEAETEPGMITRGRRRPRGWTADGILPMAMRKETNCWSNMVLEANDICKDAIMKIDETTDSAPVWLPRESEQLCNLVGSWRILQRVGSHRWTTDDLVTAFVAGKYGAKKYLDLGCGNASVLLMTSWCLNKHGPVDTIIVGVEARSEAVALARRSIAFNLGIDGATIVHSDFRDFDTTHKFQLVTGTPPYFRVDFDVHDKTTVISAKINQGGMPSSKQSAPARCEFRGGIEAYCATAVKFLDLNGGRFCVCENWLNHHRVVQAALESKLSILEQWHVHGRSGKPILFAVYVMGHDDGSVNEEATVHTLVVRDAKGDWTEQYKGTVLKEMNIPFPDETDCGSNETKY